MSISELINRYMLRSRLTQEEVGKKIGLSRSTVGNFKNGERPVDLCYLQPLAEAMGLNPEETAEFIAVGEYDFAEARGTGDLLAQARRQVTALEKTVVSLTLELQKARDARVSRERPSA